MQVRTWSQFRDPNGCAFSNGTSDDTSPGPICMQLHIQLRHAAMRRALVPDAFGPDRRMLVGRLAECLDASNVALRQAAALSGPVSVDDFKAN